MDEAEDRLELDSNLAELGRAWPWAESLADRHHLSPEARYAIHLCLEEAVANIVLHGYGNEGGHPIVIQSVVMNGWLFIEIDDEAPPFAPAVAESLPDARDTVSLESMKAGGNGIPLLRRFAGSLDYAPLPGGNRLTLGFPLASVQNNGASARIVYPSR